jgi:hypothetical protein
VPVRRFEQLLKKPSPFWEIEVVGFEVRAREGIAGSPTTESKLALADADAATSYADAEIASRRAAGFVEIKRLAPCIDEERVKRERSVEWSVGLLRHYRTVQQYDRTITLQSGHIFREGHVVSDRTEQSFPTIAEASAFFDRMIADARSKMLPETDVEGAAVTRRSKRVRSVERASPATPTFTSNESLEALCFAARLAAHDAIEPWSVYADFLISHNDPRGEIAALALGGKLLEARATLETHFGELWEQGLHLAFGLHHGFVREVQLEIDQPVVFRDVIARVLGSPLCRFVDSIGVGVDDGVDPDWQVTLDAILETPQASRLRVLQFACHYERGGSHCDFGDAWQALPALEELELSLMRGACELGRIDAPRLRRFVLGTTELGPAQLAAIANARWPLLDHLEIGGLMEQPAHAIQLKDLAPIFSARGLPALRHLGLVNIDLPPRLVTGLVDSLLLPQLDSLAFVRVTGNELARSIVRHAPAFRHLAAFDLEEADLDTAELERIKRVLDNVILGMPVDDEDAHYDGVDE